jgi:hypothetical protein
LYFCSDSLPDHEFLQGRKIVWYIFVLPAPSPAEKDKGQVVFIDNLILGKLLHIHDLEALQLDS